MPTQTVELNLTGANDVRVDLDAFARTCRLRVPPGGEVADVTVGAWESLTMGISVGVGLSLTASRRDVTLPALVSATIAADGDTVTLVFSEPVSGAQNGDFRLDDDSLNTYPLTTVSGDGTATQVFSTGAFGPVPGVAVVTIRYTPGTVADVAGNLLAAFSGRSATNNSTQ